jgi:tetratricopeptide (TPR) repeat protein
VGAGLQALVRRELIRPDESTLAGEDAYSFCHLLIRDAAYASIPKATRADLHERFAAWLEARAGDRIAEFEEIVGYHLEEAHHLRVELSRGDARAGVLGDRGAAHLAIAGRRAMSRGDSSGAAALFERAAAIMPEDAPGRPEILVHLGGLLRETGDFARADKVLTLATELAERLGQQSLGAHARAERAYVALDSDPRAWESAADELGAAAETLRQWRDHERLAEVLVRLASAKFFRGQVLEAEQDLREASDAVERIRVPALAVRIDWSLASFADFGPAPISEGLRRVDAALATAGENPRITCELRLLQAIFVAGQGRLDEARVIAGNAEGRLGDLGENAFSIQITTEARWRIAALAGDLEQEEAAVRRCYLELESVGNLSHLASLAWRRADVLSRLGRLGEGEPYADESRRLGNRGDIDVQVGWRMAMGRILRMRERYADANRVLAEGLDIARRTDYVGHTADVLMELAHVQRAVGDRSGARRHCQEALELYERKENAVLAGRADAFLRELGPAQ